MKGKVSFLVFASIFIQDNKTWITKLKSKVKIKLDTKIIQSNKYNDNEVQLNFNSWYYYQEWYSLI